MGLHRLNRLGRAAALLSKACDHGRFSKTRPPKRILDVASGDGQELRFLFEHYDRQPECVGLDVNPVFIANAQRNKPPKVEFVEADFFDTTSVQNLGTFDLVVSSLFLHHLPRQRILEFLAKLKSATKGRIVISDLERSTFAWLCVGIASRFVTRSKIVHCDALLSVQAALTKAEFRKLLDEAGMESAHIYRAFPFRLMAIWDKEFED